MFYNVIMTKAKKTALIAFRVSDEMKEALERLARADRRSLSQYIDIVLEKHVTAAEQQRSRAK